MLIDTEEITTEKELIEEIKLLIDNFYYWDNMIKKQEKIDNQS